MGAKFGPLISWPPLINDHDDSYNHDDYHGHDDLSFYLRHRILRSGNSMPKFVQICIKNCSATKQQKLTFDLFFGCCILVLVFCIQYAVQRLYCSLQYRSLQWSGK